MAADFITEHKFLMLAITFLSVFVFVQGFFATEFISNNVTNDYTVYYNGSTLVNATSSGAGVIPTVPLCAITGSLDIIGALGCIGGYMVYFFAMLTFNSTVMIINMLFITPVLIALAYILVKMLIHAIRG